MTSPPVAGICAFGIVSYPGGERDNPIAGSPVYLGIGGRKGGADCLSSKGPARWVARWFLPGVGVARPSCRFRLCLRSVRALRWCMQGGSEMSAPDRIRTC